MKRLSGLCALVCAAIALPALAATYVQDGANMLSAGTVASLNRVIGNFNAQTGKEIVVDTVPSLNGTSLADAAHQAYTQRNVNGILIFIARDDRRDIIVPDAAGVEAGWFTRDTLDSIRSTMESQFKAEDYDGGVTSAVDGVLNIYRAHLTSGSRGQNGSGAVPATTRRSTNGGIHISMLWWIVIIGIGFLVLRSIMRAMSTPRYGPPGAVPPGGVPPAGYGYGQGGGFGGGGSFWSGLLGGLGGAWLGNEMFNRGGGGAITGQDAGQTAVTGDSSGGWGGSGSAPDAGGFQSDAGQADMGGASGGDWSGGGFGGGDIGGGGGGDFGGGGGGDSGGGW